MLTKMDIKKIKDFENLAGLTVDEVIDRDFRSYTFDKDFHEKYCLKYVEGGSIRVATGNIMDEKHFTLWKAKINAVGLP